MGQHQMSQDAGPIRLELEIPGGVAYAIRQTSSSSDQPSVSQGRSKSPPNKLQEREPSGGPQFSSSSAGRTQRRNEYAEMTADDFLLQNPRASLEGTPVFSALNEPHEAKFKHDTIRKQQKLPGPSRLMVESVPLTLQLKQSPKKEKYTVPRRTPSTSKDVLASYTGGGMHANDSRNSHYIPAGGHHESEVSAISLPSPTPSPPTPPPKSPKRTGADLFWERKPLSAPWRPQLQVPPPTWQAPPCLRGSDQRWGVGRVSGGWRSLPVGDGSQVCYSRTVSGCL